MTHQEALNIMLEAHTTGVGVVTVCEKEIAEYYCEVLKSFKLWSSIEPEDVWGDRACLPQYKRSAMQLGKELSGCISELLACW